MELRDKKGLTEAAYLAAYAQKNYPKPAATADIAVFGRAGEGLRLLLVRRGGHPYLGRWALPGGFANADEPLEATAARELAEETGLQGLGLALVGVFSAPGRDPRGWVVSAAYASLVPPTRMPALLQATQAGDDAAAAAWFTVQVETSKAAEIPVQGVDHAAPPSDGQPDAAPSDAAPSVDGSAQPSADGRVWLQGPDGARLGIPYALGSRPGLTGPQPVYTALGPNDLAFDHGQIILCALQALGAL